MTTNRHRRYEIYGLLIALTRGENDEKFEEHNMNLRLSGPTKHSLGMFPLNATADLLRTVLNDPPAEPPNLIGTVPERRKQIRRLLDSKHDEIDSYDDKPLRTDELESVIKTLETVKIPDTEHPFA